MPRALAQLGWSGIRAPLTPLFCIQSSASRGSPQPSWNRATWQEAVALGVPPMCTCSCPYSLTSQKATRSAKRRPQHWLTKKEF